MLSTHILLIGNLGRDSELRYAPNGDAVANFSLAIDKSYTDREGNEVKRTMWVKCTMWRKLAEALNQYLTKGKMVAVEGDFQFDNATGGPRTFQRQDGSTGTGFEFTVNQIKLLGRREDSGSGAHTSEAPAEAVTEGVEENIPF